MAHDFQFSYELAFDRNIGWLTDWEQQALRGKRVSIAGMGGVGGIHLLTLTRFGIGAFNIADLDNFELANFNRQFGATVETLGRPKVEVLGDMAKSINPEIRIKRFDEGIDSRNLDAFLDGTDLFVDGLDFFALDVRRQVFARCAQLGIPALTAAPIGMGAGFLVFAPSGMTFEEYFRLGAEPEERQYLRFLIGVAPRGLHRTYLVDPSRVDIAGRRGPSTVAACELCAAITAVAAIKLLLGRGGVKPAPYHHHFDAYRNKLVVSRLRFGNAGPLQRLKLAIAQRIYGSLSTRTVAPPSTQPASIIEEILNVARWAPSGDNTQPWRFQRAGDDTVVVRLRDQSDHDVYDYRGGEPTLISGGMLLESIRIAATAWRRGMEWRYDGRKDNTHLITVRLPPGETLDVDPLYASLPLRSVDRRPYHLLRLTAQQKQALGAALGSDFALDWHETIAERWRLSQLGAKATGIRLRIPEAFTVHQQIIDWEHEQSPTGIPARAVGLDRLSLLLMRWAMKDWSRTKLLNHLGGALAAALQMDCLPGLFSAGFFSIRPIESIVPSGERAISLLRAGERIQRFWLTATRLGLAIQPALATLIFASYGGGSTLFTLDPAMRDQAKELAASFKQTLGRDANSFLFLGRIGVPRPRRRAIRSTRRPLHELFEIAAGNETITSFPRRTVA